VASTDDAAKSIPQVASELWDLSTTYAKQETLGPLKGLGVFLAWGIGGALMLGTGIVLLILAGLRYMQTQTDSTFRGSLSWLPYVIVLVVTILLMALFLWRIVKKKGPGL
jgi:hypothetical protein